MKKSDKTQKKDNTEVSLYVYTSVYALLSKTKFQKQNYWSR